MAVTLPSGRWGQTLALGLSLAAVALIWVSIVAPLRDAFDDRAERLRGEQAMIRRMEALVQTFPALRNQATMAAAPSGTMLPGASDAIAAAALQQTLDGMAASCCVRIASEEILPAQTAGPFRMIGVHVTMNASYASVVVLLRALAQAETPMIAGDIALHAAVSAGHSDNGDRVDASFTVTSLRLAEPAGSGKPDTPGDAR